jgi:phage terminase large subunit-like protein
LVLNQRVEVSNPFVSLTAWKDCGAAVDHEALKRVPIYAGLDLSSVSDLTALVLIGKIERTWHVEPTFWLPAEGLYDKAKRDRIPYDLWHSEGFLQTTPGASVSYEYVAQFLFKVFAEYNIAKLAFDRWGMQHLKPWLLKAGFSEQLIEAKFVAFGQGTVSMSPALRDLEQVIKEKELAHGDHVVLTMCAVNSVLESKSGSDADRKLSKKRSTGRIDGMVALAMAFGVAPQGKGPIDVEALIA